MLAHLTMLRYWKSEHNEETCEDAYGENASQGLFAVADGAGTTLFSGVWAALLVKHFLHIPLLSNDPFEVEWWVRLIQEQFKQELPMAQNMPWNALQKVQDEGSQATLATVRMTNIDDTHAIASVLAFGDSCVLVYHPITEQLFSFPLTDPAEFDRAPICIPSKASIFNRSFHQCRVTTLDLVPSDVVVIATDAVSRWIVSAGGGRYPSQSSAFRELVQQTPATWAAFIQRCRANKEMVDDDSTALVIRFVGARLIAPVAAMINSSDIVYADGGRDQSGPYDDDGAALVRLGTTTEHNKSVRENRVRDFMQAVKDQHKERVAVYSGDSADIYLEGVQAPQNYILQARAVADAQSAVLNVLRRELNNPQVAAIVTPVWQKYAQLLYNEPCAENLRKTLTRLGVPLEPMNKLEPSPEPVMQEQVPVENVQPALEDEASLFHAQFKTFTKEELALIERIKGAEREEI